MSLNRFERPSNILLPMIHNIIITGQKSLESNNSISISNSKLEAQIQELLTNITGRHAIKTAVNRIKGELKDGEEILNKNIEKILNENIEEIKFGGLPKDRPTIQLDSNLVHYKELIVTGTTACSTADCWQASAIVNSGLIDLSDLISHRFPLVQAAAAFAMAEDRKSLKIVLEP